MSILKQTRDLLKEEGFDVYFPSQHKGECISKYIVIKRDGTVSELGVSSERPIYTIMCYVPENKYSELDDFVLQVKDAMRGMYPTLIYEGNETSSLYEEDNKSHMVSFQYLNCRRILLS